MSKEPYYLLDGTHVLIAGATGSGDEYGGKSVLANWWFDQSVRKGHRELGVYINPKRLRFVRGTTVSSLKGMAEAYQSGKRRFDVRFTGEEAHGRLMRMLRRLPGDKIVVHDEAQSYRSAESLDWALSQAGNLAHSDEPTGDIRSLVVTQRPWNLPEQQRANMPLKIWVGPFGSEAKRFFQSEAMGEAADKVETATGPYRWSVTDGGDYIRTHAPVPAEYAEG